MAVLRHSRRLAGLSPWHSLPPQTFLCSILGLDGVAEALSPCGHTSPASRDPLPAGARPVSVTWSPCFISPLNLLGELLWRYGVSCSLLWDACLSEGKCCVTSSSVQEAHLLVNGCWFTWAKHRPLAQARKAPCPSRCPCLCPNGSARPLLYSRHRNAFSSKSGRFGGVRCDEMALHWSAIPVWILWRGGEVRHKTRCVQTWKRW